jgi:hypothetical protein
MNDDRLRAALLDLGDVPPPPDLAGAALTRARRDRNRRVTGLVALVAVLAAAAVTVPALVLHRVAATQTAGPALGRFLIAGYASRDPSAATAGLGRYELYQRSGAGYAVAPGRAAVPSPDGRTVALVSDRGRAGLVPADQVDDPGAVRWIPASSPVTDVVWSPDSHRLYLPQYSQLRRSSWPRMTSTALVVDVAGTLAAHTVRLDRVPVELPTGQGRVVFGPGGDGFAAVDHPQPTAAAQLRIWGGKRQQWNLSVHPLSLPDQPFSPSGWLLAGSTGGGSTVIDVASGGELATVEGRVVGWYDEDRLVVLSGRSVQVVDYRSGRVLAQREVAAAGRQLTGVWLTPARGEPPSGAIVL